MPGLSENFGPEDFAAAVHVSRETLDRLRIYVDLLEVWNQKHNLVSQSTLADVWQRHVYDSAQLADYVPETAKTLADFGSGAGFPGLVLALLLKGRVAVSLFESTRKKCDFLQAAAEKMQLTVTIRNERIEAAPRQIFDVITARACTSLAGLCGYAQGFAGKTTVCLFPKGRTYAEEIAEAQKKWRMKLVHYPSRTHTEGRIVVISQLHLSGSASRSGKAHV